MKALPVIVMLVVVGVYAVAYSIGHAAGDAHARATLQAPSGDRPALQAVIDQHIKSLQYRIDNLSRAVRELQDATTGTIDTTSAPLIPTSHEPPK